MKNIEQVATLKSWDEKKKKAQVILANPVEWRDLLDSKVEEVRSSKLSKSISESHEFEIYKEAVIEIIDTSGPRNTLSNLLNRLPNPNEGLLKYVSSLKERKFLSKTQK